VLQRGFALVRDADGRAVRRAGQIAAGQRLELELADGRVAAEALSGGAPGGGERGGGESAAQPADTGASMARKPPRSRSPQGGQGSLF
jgi:exodeoxyribonuclease VII large subunit